MPRRERILRSREGYDGRTVVAIARSISDLLVRGARANYELGHVIDRVTTERLWRCWVGGTEFTTFNDWCWNVLGFRQRKARELQANYRYVSAMNLDERAMGRILKLGWTKLAHLRSVAQTEEQLIAWCDRIEIDRISEEALRGEVSIAKSRAEGQQSEGSFDDVDGDESNGGPPASSPSPRSDRQGNRRIKYPLVFTEDEDLRTFVAALRLIRQRVNPEMSYGAAAALMATNYLGVAARDDEGGIAVELEQLISSIEQTYNVRLVLAADQPAPPRRAEAPAAPVEEDDPLL